VNCHLAGLRVWHDPKIDAGDKWYPEVRESMADAAAAVLLISPDDLVCPRESIPEDFLDCGVVAAYVRCGDDRRRNA
jgi:hypothetical protein